ncbi:B12-binding domain-containing radical SAM protein [Thiospirochaeta perfilievii]|uniref:B12-binding domain-containing radical SAM protein n=1 Tax=Thiospirochaeta perfilievii TaxID=252967 RepID=A0A5C1QED0_9SPIO|nr:radical SAM protein [Thiospirochaeta perfilievii]QEN05738.1 B12-binding domain-containing radical SAM protein [Thiospirochaeta perfilievii]
MNIILTSVHINKTPDAIPLAPALLKSYLLEDSLNKEIKVDILESTLDKEIEEFATEILRKKPTILGISVYLWNRDFYLELVNYIRTINSELIIIAGGAEVRSSYLKLLKQGINYTIQGEGEETFSKVIKCILNKTDPNEISGVNDNNLILVNDLNTIPSPILNKTIDLTKYDGFLWELSRGCPFSCDFCFESRGAKGVRYYSLERVELELKEIIKQDVPQVFVLDPTFNKDLKRAKTILELILKLNKGTHFHFEVRAELIDREIASLFNKIEASLQIGIQSSHNSVLKLVNRGLDRELFKDKIGILNEHGVTFGLDLIYGLPGDSYEGFKESMEFVLSLQPNHLDIFPLSVLPGTALWDNSEELELNFDKNPPYTVISSPTFSKEDMRKSKLLKESCDFIYNKCKSTGWLLQVTKELKISTIKFIEDFVKWNTNYRKNRELTDIDIIKKYINDSFNPEKFSLICDIINYHSAYSKALLSVKKRTYISKNKLMESVPTLSNSSSFIYFKYPVLDAFDNGLYTISEIKKYFKPSKSNVICWYHLGGEVIFEMYTKRIMTFLNSVNGKISSKLIDRDVDIEFLNFAQESGLLLFT